MKKRILPSMLALCVVLAMLPGTALAADQSGTYGDRGDNIKWTLNSAGVLTISGSGNMRNGDYHSYGNYTCSPWCDGTSRNVTSVTIKSGVNNIGNIAFRSCENLTRITIPDTVNSIGSSAFYECKNLVRIIIPDSVTTIGQSAFQNCSRLSSVILPNELTELGSYLFYNCSNLAVMTIPSSVTAIGQYALAGCSKLDSITIPSGVTSVGNYAFQNCSNVTTVKILSKSISLGKNAFDGCSNLTSIDLPRGVDMLDDGLFSNCSNLTKVSIPSSVELIGANIFNNCTRLKDIYFSGSQQQWNNIYIDETNNEFLASVNIHYNSGSDEPETYTVTLDPTGGSVSTTEKEYKANAALGTLPTPTRTGYKFNGWYTEETGGTKVTERSRVHLTADQTLYARWQASVTVRDLDSDTCEVTVPASYELALYTTDRTATISSVKETDDYLIIHCTQKAELSNGTVRYYGRVDGKSYWFTYSCEMDDD